MKAWIELNGVRSDTLDGVIIEEITPPLLGTRKVSRAAVSGRLGPVDQGTAEPEPETIGLQIIVRGEGRERVLQNLYALRPYLLKATKLKLWHDEARYYQGGFETGATVTRLTDKALRVSAQFTVCPPCSLRAKSRQINWEPSGDRAVPEQITDLTKTTSGAFTAAGRLPIMRDGGAYPPALYFKVTGTWGALTIGQMALLMPAAAQTTVYIDCDNQIAYKLDGGVKVSVPISGDYPTNDALGIQVAGESLAVNVYALMIERG